MLSELHVNMEVFDKLQKLNNSNSTDSYPFRIGRINFYKRIETLKDLQTMERQLIKLLIYNLIYNKNITCSVSDNFLNFYSKNKQGELNYDNSKNSNNI